jgi:hypothetical protein
MLLGLLFLATIQLAASISLDESSGIMEVSLDNMDESSASIPVDKSATKNKKKKHKKKKRKPTPDITLDLPDPSGATKNQKKPFWRLNNKEMHPSIDGFRIFCCLLPVFGSVNYTVETTSKGRFGFTNAASLYTFRTEATDADNCNIYCNRLVPRDEGHGGYWLNKTGKYRPKYWPKEWPDGLYSEHYCEFLDGQDESCWGIKDNYEGLVSEWQNFVEWQ